LAEIEASSRRAIHEKSLDRHDRDDVTFMTAGLLSLNEGFREYPRKNIANVMIAFYGRRIGMD
jgi:hypothetical protein